MRTDREDDHEDSRKSLGYRRYEGCHGEKEYLAELKVGGLGIYLMRTLKDEVDYDIKPGVRNQVKMVKYFLNKAS